MTVVLDTSAAVALTDPNSAGHAAVADIFENHVCYMTREAVLWFFCSLYDQQGRAPAEYWLAFVTDGSDIRLAEGDVDREFLESAGRAIIGAGKLMHTGTSAALARRLKVPIVTNARDIEALESDGFCEVRRF